MTNTVADIAAGIQPAPAAVPSQGPVFIEPIPWAWLLLLALWFGILVVIISSIIVFVLRKRKGLRADGVARRCIVFSTFVIFLGTGINLWSLAKALIDLQFVQISHVRWQVLELSRALYGLAINTILSGFGFTIGMILSGSKQLEDEQQ